MSFTDFWGNFGEILEFLGKISSKNWLRNIVALIAGIEKNFSQGGGSGEGRHPVYLTLQLTKNTKNGLLKFCIFVKISRFHNFSICGKISIQKFSFFEIFKILPFLKCSVLVFCGTLSEILNFFRVFSLLFFTLSEWFLHVIC